ncbi:hypothetical protein M8J75_007632 [Diaphorina citri]|nr:hypothetical protein M8J75_007632 [Diaphorina citri]
MVSLIPEWMMTRIDFIKDEIVTHEVVDNWFLMPSWLPVTSIVVLYLIFVKIVGPRMMENRKPYNIKNIILVYNLVQTVYNAYILSYPRETNPLWMTFCEASYLYFISKIVDLLDTIFFVLRKKNSQISFLHVYHHVMMVFATWAFLRYFKGEQGIFVGALNSLVHVVMYSYYFLAALGPETQFGLFCIHQVSLIVFSCDMPVALTYFIFSQAVVMCVLFGNFYYQTYTKKNK